MLARSSARRIVASLQCISCEHQAVGRLSRLRSGATARAKMTAVTITNHARHLHSTGAAAASEDNAGQRSDRIRVRKEVTYLDRVSGKTPWVQYLKIILTPETADYELTPEQLVGFANNHLMAEDADPPPVFYNGGWDPERALPNGKGTVTFADDTCVEHEAWGEVWDARYEEWLALMKNGDS